MRWPRDALDRRCSQIFEIVFQLEIQLFLSVNFGRYPSLGAAQKKQQHELSRCVCQNGIFRRRPDSFATHFLIIELAVRGAEATSESKPS